MLLLPATTSDVKRIDLTQGKIALVSVQDFDRLSRFKWQALFNGNRWYAVRCTPGTPHGITYMHRDVTGAQLGQDGDHKRRTDTLDNTRQNLRVASRSQNLANRDLSSHNAFGFTGIKRKPSGKFIGVVTRLGKQFRTKVQDTIEQAAKARDVLAQSLFGEYAAQTYTN
jgi:hypothetical protein